MAGTGKRPTEDKLVSKLRLIGALVLLGGVVFVVIAPALNFSIFREAYRPDAVIVGTMIGGGLLLLGVETVNRLPGINLGGKSKSEEDDK